MNQAGWPGVSVIMPVRNEERHLAAAVAGVLAQDYPGEIEVIMAVGPSSDATSEDRGRTGRAGPQGTGGGQSGRPDSDRPQSRPSPPPASTSWFASTGTASSATGYIARAVELLDETGADNVGGVMDAQGTTPFEQAVAHAYTSRLGLGGAAFHLGNVPAGPVETVFLGVFRKAALLAVGGFDESMWRAQDWELNYRLRRSGRTVWFSPELRVTYRPRSRVRDLAKQMFETGRWRREVVRRHPETASVRYLAPPAAVAAIGAGSLLALLGPALGARWLRVGFLAPAGYAGVIVLGAATAPSSLPAAARIRLPLVLAVTHLCWGAGFLIGLPQPRFDTMS